MKLIECEKIENVPSAKEIKSLLFIFQNVSHQKEKLKEKLKKENEDYIIGKIRTISNEIYSGCEIINQLLINVYRNDERYRGCQLRRGFNDNFKCVYKTLLRNGDEISAIYKDNFISLFFDFAKTWFVDLHDIRTQETHYEVGKVECIDGEMYYINGNRNGVSKQIYTNYSDSIRIRVYEFIFLVGKFLEAELWIAKLLKKFDKK